MIITISASMKQLPQVLAVAKKVESLGHTVFTPSVNTDMDPTDEWSLVKKKLIDEHLDKLRQSDALLVVNVDGGTGYGRVGASTFLEIGCAYALGKAVFLLNHPDPTSTFTEDILAIQPTILHGDLKLINDTNQEKE